MIKFIFYLIITVAPIISIYGLEEMVILGSGPAGLTAAIYAGRAQLNPLVVEGNAPGGQLMTTALVENYPGFPEGVLGPELMSRLREQALRFGATLQSGQVVAVDLSKHPFRLLFENGDEITAKSLIIATGASPKWLGVPSEKDYVGYGLSTCAICDGFFYKDRPVVVVGGGDTAVEEALYLANIAKHVTLIHRRSTLKASPLLQERLFQNPKIRFVKDSIVEEVIGIPQEKVKGVKIKDLTADMEAEIACEGIFIAIGHVPNTGLFRGQLEMDGEGYLSILPFSTSTNTPGVFVAGDAAQHACRQAVTAAGTGAQAAIEAERFLKQMPLITH